MDISLIILTWNSNRYIENCLNSILASLKNSKFTYEILIVDNGSTDQTPKQLKKFSEQYSEIIKPTFLKENKGTTIPRNLALKQACGDCLCVIDSDVEVPSKCFPSLVEVLSQDSKTGLVAPKICYPSGRWQKSTDRFPTLVHKINRLFRLRQIEQQEAQIEGNQYHIRPVDYAISAFWLFKKDLLEKVGLFDERIFYSPEDVDYCLRIWKAGYKILFVPTITVIHHTQEISRGFKFNRAKISHVKGLLYLFLKHGYLFRAPSFAD